jgi:serine/threonine protein phosphatase PrpC
MNRATRVGAVITGALVAVLLVGACSNGSLSTPSSAPTTAAPTTAAPTTAAPTTAAPTTEPVGTSGDGSETPWFFLFLVAALLAVAIVAVRRVSPAPGQLRGGESERLRGTESERQSGAELDRLRAELERLRAELERTRRIEPPSREFPPTIGDAQPSASEEPLLQPSAAMPSDVFVHAGKIRRKGGRDLVLRAASVRGTASRLERKERQDAYSFVARGERLIVAVADGVGSLPHSGLAARTAARGSCQRIEEVLDTSGELDDASIVRIFESSAWEVVLAAREHAGDPELPAKDAARSMATTLVVGAIDFGSSRELRLTVARVGDSSAWLLRMGEAVALFRGDEAGAIVDTKTFALPGFGAEGVEVKRTPLEPDDVLIFATDGFAGSWGSGFGEVADYFRSAWRRPPDHITFAGHVAYRRRTFDDDRTAVALWV